MRFAQVEGLLKRLNPSAAIERTQNSVIDVPHLLSQPDYDESAFSTMPEWAEELAKEPALSAVCLSIYP
jgi:G3E family GTPase